MSQVLVLFIERSLLMNHRERVVVLVWQPTSCTWYTFLDVYIDDAGLSLLALGVSAEFRVHEFLALFPGVRPGAEAGEVTETVQARPSVPAPVELALVYLGLAKGTVVAQETVTLVAPDSVQAGPGVGGDTRVSGTVINVYVAVSSGETRETLTHVQLTHQKILHGSSEQAVNPSYNHFTYR